MIKKLVHVATAPLVLTALMLAMPAAALVQAQGDGLTRLYKVEHVSLDSAVTLARSVCEEEQRKAIADPDGNVGNLICEVARLQDEQMLTIIAEPAVQARIRGLLDELDQMPQTRSFHIVVLAASRIGSQMANVPPAVEQALRDISEFLPYTSFAVLGSGWLRSSESGETTLPGPMEFSAHLRFRPSTDADAPILMEGFAVYRRIGATYSDTGELARDAEFRAVLETTFTIAPGETVVVGTSKLNGDDDALVVVLTAVAR